MEATGSGLRSRGDRRVRLFSLGLRRLRLGLILYDSDVRGSGRSWCPVAVRRHSQMFELTLLLAPAQGATS